MAVQFRLKDGEGSSRDAGVTNEHAVKVALVEQAANTIPVSQLIRQKQLREFLVNGGSKSLNVDGSSSSVEFSVAAEEGKAKWILNLRIILNDTNMELNTNDFRRFGTAAIDPGLTNGIEFFTDQEGIITNIVAEPVLTIGDFMNYQDEYENLVNVVDSQVDFLTFDFDMDAPVVLPAGSSDRIVCRINDDLTSVDKFEILARGYQELL